MPRLEACYFGTQRQDQWTRMATVLRFTAAHHCPGWAVNVCKVTPASRRSARASDSNVANMQKMDVFRRVVLEAVDGEQLLLIDTDTMILRSLDDVWDETFDLAYTTKPGARFPFNAGVMFLRISDRVRRFMEAWWEENERMLHDKRYHLQFLPKYGGLNQAALGALLHRQALADLSVLQLPCVQWNCEDSAWGVFDPARTRIVHLKAELRKAVFRRGGGWPASLTRLADLWRLNEARATEDTRRSA